MVKQRDFSIDICRVIGLFGVILAHTQISELLMSIRQFDVIMLVMVSAMSFTYSANISTFKDYLKYCYKRFIRLIVPVWIFLIAYYLLDYFTGQWIDIHTLISSFLLIRGIGYVWIFRVLFICALVNPLILILVKKFNIKGNKTIIYFLVIWLIYEVVYSLAQGNITGSAFKLLDYSIFYTIAYALISYVGIVYRNCSNKQTFGFVGAFILFVCGYLLLGFNFDLQMFKYPPRCIYLAYGLAVTLICLIVFDQIKWKNTTFITIINWLSKNSFNIYFVHILVIKYFDLQTSYNLSFIQPIWIISISILFVLFYQKIKGVILIWKK